MSRVALPRESRDTLFLLAVIAWIIAPQTAHLPLWCSAMAAGGNVGNCSCFKRSWCARSVRSLAS